jgi:alkanesulfonate monooxygenase SsuD/methylene tetrahydromethanopterin reductase-like flavin-dependent oxidoreductase (luciferase family)
MLSFGVTVLPDPPASRVAELMKLAEQHGFDYGWTYDSHILWHDPYPLLTMAALETSTLKLGLNVTNPGTREPTVTASAFATLQAISGGRMIIGIGRGDSARRTIGQKPVSVGEFERSVAMIRDLTNGRPVRWNDFDIHLEWAQGRRRSRLCGYGPRCSRSSDGCRRHHHPARRPDIIEWIVGQVRASAEEAGRDHPRSRSWPARWHTFHDPADAREQVRCPGHGLEPRLRRVKARQVDPVCPHRLRRADGTPEHDHRRRVGASTASRSTTT